MVEGTWSEVFPVLLVTELPGTGPVPRNPGLWDRVMAHTKAFTLDRDLARGASPDGTVRLALRARRLTGMRERRSLARAIRHFVGQADHPVGKRWPPVPVCWDRVRASAAEFEFLADRLARQEPVSARGVAQVSLLLHDGGGPLYWDGSTDALAARVHQAVTALDTPGTW
jgi:hypothetical protein